MRRILLLALLTATTQAQWQLQQSHSTASLRGIHALGNGVAWASGAEGTVLRTTDDGATWQPCAIPPNAEHLDFRGIQAFDARTAIVMSSGKGDLSRLYKTTDGCQTWKLVFTNPDKEGFWDAVQLPENGQGFLIGDPVGGNFVIYVTYGGRDTFQRWQPSRSHLPAQDVRPARANKNESIFAASNSAIVAPAGNGSFAFVTGGEGGSRLFLAEAHSPFDNGTVWKFKITKLSMRSGSSSGAFSLAIRQLKPFSADLMIVGGDYMKPESPSPTAFLPNRNNCCFGVLPQKAIVSNTPPHGYRSAVAYSPTHKAWITVGPNGTDLSTDDGRIWRPLKPTAPNADPEEDQHWNALSLPFVVGPKGRIGKLRPRAIPDALPR